jgi:hypothetical protein
VPFSKNHLKLYRGFLKIVFSYTTKVEKDVLPIEIYFCAMTEGFKVALLSGLNFVLNFLCSNIFSNLKFHIAKYLRIKRF